MKITTWNVNSLKVRLPQVLKWLEKNPVDVLCIQETKLTDDKFPQAEIEAAGYHVAFTGQKTYNGVAILSKHPMTEVQKITLNLKMNSNVLLRRRSMVCGLFVRMYRMVRRRIRISFSTNSNGWHRSITGCRKNCNVTQNWLFSAITISHLRTGMCTIPPLGLA